MHQFHQVVCVCMVLESIFLAVWTRCSRNSRIYASISSGCLRLSGTEEHFSRDLDKALSKFPDICINFFRLYAFVWYRAFSGDLDMGLSSRIDMGWRSRNSRIWAYVFFLMLLL